MINFKGLEQYETVGQPFTINGGTGKELLECCPLPITGGMPRFSCNVLETGNVPEGTPFADMPRRRIDPEINVTGELTEPSLVKAHGMPGPIERRPFCKNRRFSGEVECTVYRTKEYGNVIDCIPVTG